MSVNISPDLFSISLFVKVPQLSFRETIGSHNHNHLRLSLSDRANNWRKKQVKGVTLESLLAMLLLSVIWFGLSENCLSQSNSLFLEICVNYSFSCSESWGGLHFWIYLLSYSFVASVPVLFKLSCWHQIQIRSLQEPF